MKNLIAICLSIFSMASFAQEVQKRKITPAQIDAVFSQWDTADRPGIAVGVLNDGKVAYVKGYGLANLEHKVPITANTKFHIGDLAKEFTVYALLLLEQRGQLSLDDDIRKHLPQLPSFAKPVSIKQLLHHTSGLNNDEVVRALSGWAPSDSFNKEQAYAMIHKQAKTLPKSGSLQQPSDAGFMILEDLITKVANKSYADFVSEELFAPLGMKNSVFDTQGKVIPGKAQGYFAQGDDFISSRLHSSQTLVSDLYTTVTDMCLWAKELESPKIGTIQMVNKFDELSVVDGQKVQEVNTARYTGGHGFWDFRGAKKLYHIEVAGGYASKLIRYPDHDLAVVVMGNDGAYNGYACTGASALYIEDFLDPMPSPEASATVKTKKMSSKQLSAFEGYYWDEANHTSRQISMVNDTLRYVRGRGNQSALVPIANNTFKMITRGEVTVQFKPNAESKNMVVTVGDDIFDMVAYDPKADWTNDLKGFTGTYHADALGTSYTLVIKDDTLILTHPRLATVQLAPRIQDVFSGNSRHFDALAFKKDSKGSVIGFKLATNGIADMWFAKKAVERQDFAKTR